MKDLIYQTRSRRTTTFLLSHPFPCTLCHTTPLACPVNAYCMCLCVASGRKREKDRKDRKKESWRKELRRLFSSPSLVGGSSLIYLTWPELEPRYVSERQSRKTIDSSSSRTARCEHRSFSRLLLSSVHTIHTPEERSIVLLGPPD